MYWKRVLTCLEIAGVQLSYHHIEFFKFAQKVLEKKGKLAGETLEPNVCWFVLSQYMLGKSRYMLL